MIEPIANQSPPRQQVAFPEVATLHKGTPKQKKTGADGKEYLIQGKDLVDRFRLHFLPGTEAVEAAWAEKTGAKPVNYGKNFADTGHNYEIATFRAIVPAQSVWEAWNYSNDVYNASGIRVAMADDHHYLFERNPLNLHEYFVQDGVPLKKWMPGDGVSYERNGKQIFLPFKSRGRLRLVFEDMVTSGHLVQVVLRTSSYYDCQNIKGQLQGIQGIADTIKGGNAGGVAFEVYRSQQEVSYVDKDGGGHKSKHWYINVKADSRWVKAAFDRLGEYALTGGVISQAFLPAPAEIQGAVNPDLEPLDDEENENGAHAVVEGASWDAQPFEQNKAEVPPKPPAPPAPAGQIERPLTPAVLRSFLATKASRYGDYAASLEQRGLMVGMMEEAFAPDKDANKIRRSCVRYLWDVGSSKELSGAEVKALLDWLKPTKDSGGAYHIDEMAAQELHSVWTAAQVAAGQEALPL